MIQIVQCLVCPFCCENIKEQSLRCSKLNSLITVDYEYNYRCQYQTPAHRNEYKEYQEERFAIRFGDFGGSRQTYHKSVLLHVPPTKLTSDFNLMDYLLSTGQITQEDIDHSLLVQAQVEEEKKIEEKIASTLHRLQISEATSKNYHEIIYYLKQAYLKDIYVDDWKIKYVVDWNYTELANIRRKNETIELLKRTSFNANSFCAQFKYSLNQLNHITISYAHSCELDYEDGGNVFFNGYDITAVFVKEIYGKRYIVLCYDPIYDSNGNGEKAMSTGDILSAIRNTNGNLPIILQNRKNDLYEPILAVQTNALFLYCFIFGINSPDNFH